MTSISYRLHALQQMAARGISRADVQQVLTHGVEVEWAHRQGRPYPNRLLLGWRGDRPLHVLVAHGPDGTQYVITAYEPSLEQWEPDYRARKTRKEAP